MIQNRHLWGCVLVSWMKATSFWEWLAIWRFEPCWLQQLATARLINASVAVHDCAILWQFASYGWCWCVVGSNLLPPYSTASPPRCRVKDWPWETFHPTKHFRAWKGGRGKNLSNVPSCGLSCNKYIYLSDNILLDGIYLYSNKEAAQFFLRTVIRLQLPFAQFMSWY